MAHTARANQDQSKPKRRVGTGWKLGAFVRDQDGAITGLSVFLFLILLMIGGIGVDIMYSEMERTKLQQTLDRAVLAAADLEQERDPKLVVADYFTKAGMEKYLSSVTVTEGIGFRNVTATATTSIDTMFMKMLGIETLTVPAAGAAEESIGNVELSLVLDISGSMGSNKRLANLKVAAKDFVDTLLQHTEEGNLSISIVPYATQVNAGEPILSKYNVSQEHSYSHCVNFIPDQFSKHGLDRAEPLERTMHFDPFTYSEAPIDLPVCPTRAGSQILPLTDDRAELHAYIDSMTHGGNTSIDLGMKWGASLLDPSMQSVVTELIDEGEVESKFAGRPSSYDDFMVLKVVVIMSDGQHTDQYFLNPSMRDTLSPVWYNAKEDKYSVYHSKGKYNYFWPHTGTWHDYPYGNGENSVCLTNDNCAIHENEDEAVQLMNKDLTAQASLKWIASELFYFSNSAYADWFTSAFSKKNASAKDNQLKNICSITKDQGVIVFAIGFEAPRQGRRVLENCASSDSHYFDAKGLEISDAFETIAVAIRQLRLTQ
ncbi:pilus assembly protein [Shimia biformata]|uniref:pilus assembly protein n=1 Tax=Shimia biformata TaxID=1294299 RepID=UPI001952908C|nr:pilus assembly protein [Shimia biformata]